MSNNSAVKYLSFSLWGSSPVYTMGAIRNAALAKKIYPSWQVIVYHDDTVPADILKRLDQAGVMLEDMTDSGVYGLFWRFLAADRPDCDYAIFRDTDSRLSRRERKAVDEWMANGDVLHIMRDHPFHQVPYGAEGLSILGGMWGIRGNTVRLRPLIDSFINDKPDEYGIDQAFLQQIYQQFKDSQTVHDDFFEKKPFPVKRHRYRFVGERIDEREHPVGDDWKHIRKYEKKQRVSFFIKLKQLLTK
ncbi:hypothetical protein [Parapedobacter pyrenivorans]|uniref:hypothetical protein n=1 Tax=Parapedobacter pyrenivorans TaxID=1305674 RepID=UPI0033405CC5